MAVPDFQALMLPLLRFTSDGQQHTYAEAVEPLALELQLSEDERTEEIRSGGTRLRNRIGWTATYLRKAGLLQAVGPGRFQLTDRGREVLASNPAAIDVAFLKKQFAEFSDFTKLRLKHQHAAEELPAIYNAADGTWNLRTGVEERVRGKLELAIPNEETRHAALSFLAFAMDNADQERSNAWYISERRRGLRLIAGRRIACEIAGSHIQVSVIGPVRDEVRAALGADAEGD